MQCIELLSTDKPSLIFKDHLEEQECSIVLKDRSQEDPEECLRYNVTGNILLKARLLNRLGIGPKFMDSMSKEIIQSMLQIYAHEKKQYDDEENCITNGSTGELEIGKPYLDSEGDFLMNFCNKTDDEIRQGFLNRLINMKMLKMNPTKKHQTMIIYDWDDTLLCTTYLSRFGFANFPTGTLDPLKDLDIAASQLLLESVKYGQTFIITNSAKGWVQMSGKIFLPKTYQVIVEQKIKVISARNKYGTMFPGDFYRWKLHAFLGIERHFEKNIITNLISLGDSESEMKAAHVLGRKFKNVLVKTIKFKMHPKPDDLVKQLTLVKEKFDQVYLNTTDLTIRLEKKSSKTLEVKPS